MKVSTIAVAGLLVFLSVARLAGWCPGNQCSTPAKSTATSAALPSSETGAVTAAAEAGFIPLEKAVAQARSENKLVMVDVYTDWCVWCKRLDHDVYPDAGVQAELKKYFAASKINAESPTVHSFNGQQLSEQQLAQGWRVTGYPTVLFLSAQGEVLQTLPGYLPPKDFAQVLRYMGTGAYKTEAFEKWQSEQHS